MNATMNKLLKTAAINVELVTSPYGILAPTLRVSLTGTCSYRETRALAHMLAAEIELAIPPRETWPVTVGHTSERAGTIEIELIKGTAEEAERAMAVLRSITRS